MYDTFKLKSVPYGTTKNINERELDDLFWGVGGYPDQVKTQIGCHNLARGVRFGQTILDATTSKIITHPHPP